MAQKWGKSAKFQLFISHYLNINGIRVKCYEIPLWVREKRFIKFGEV